MTASYALILLAGIVIGVAISSALVEAAKLIVQRLIELAKVVAAVGIVLLAGWGLISLILAS